MYFRPSLTVFKPHPIELRPTQVLGSGFQILVLSVLKIALLAALGV